MLIVPASFLSWIFERCIRQFEFASAQQSYGVYQAARRIAHFFMKGFFLIEVIMTRGVRSIVSNVTCDDAAITGGDETHVREPIRKHTSQGFHTSRIPMDHYRENATC